MTKTVVYEVDVMFGDCDPAGIVFFPNFSKWMDASSLHFFMECGIPPWRELAKTTGMGRESLYKALSGEGNPSFATILKVTHALGLKLYVGHGVGGAA
jgi:hypothetical protein